MFLNYLENKDLVLAYTKNEDGGYGVIDNYSPYLLEEIRTSEDVDVVPLVSTKEIKLLNFLQRMI